MLILTRREGESLIVELDGKPVKVLVQETKGNQVKIGIDAPKEVQILREELKKASPK